MTIRIKKPARKTVHLHPHKLLWWLLTAVLVVLVSFWAFVAFYTIQRYSDQWSDPPVKLFLSAPKYLSANEDEKIHFAVENGDNNDVNVEYQLANNGPFLGFLALEGNNVFYSGPVLPHEQINRQLEIFFPWDITQTNNMLGKVIELSLWGSVRGTSTHKIADLPISIAPIPWAKSLRYYLGTALAGVVLWLCKELWDRVKELSKKTI